VRAGARAEGGVPYVAALVVAGLALAGYALTLAPTVTFWDAGELIAAARTLGIPHPPGTPVFVLLAHVWAALLPIGEYAVRTNLLSATAAAAAAGLFFLVAHETTARLAGGLDPGSGRLVRLGGAGAAAVVGAFTFTNWQNSNETEVYATAVFAVALISWLCFVWRRRDGDAPGLLLLILYLFALSVGNHLLALLAGPAVVTFLAAALVERPPADRSVRAAAWARVAVVAGGWALIVGIGLGGRAVLVTGALAFLGSTILARRAGQSRFAAAALAVAIAGLSSYLFLYFRAAQHPVINEADPSTFNALLDVMRRAQYPVRTPLDDPTLPHGPANPGRTPGMLWLQLLNYLQYFDWQWARSVGATVSQPFGRLPLRSLVTLAFASLGLRGMLVQRRRDRAGWWLLLLLFLVTGLGLVAYMNFKPGFSHGYDAYPKAEDHEVRERDYFFVASFIVWGLWAGIGLADLARRACAAAPRARRALAAAALAIALVPVALNGPAASRRHGADARLAADWAYDLLNTAPPYGILFTYGDNDTFPLWWAQEVAGIRRDVAVVCLALANTGWYMRQLRDLPPRSFEPGAAPAVWRDRSPDPPSWPLHTMTDAEIRLAGPQRIAHSLVVDFGPLRHVYAANSVFQPSDVLAIRVIQQNLGRRPIVWATTAGRSFAGLGNYVVQQGLGFRLEPLRPDSGSAALYRERFARVPLDVALTSRLLWATYRYAELPSRGGQGLDPTSRSIGEALAEPFTRLAAAHDHRGAAGRARLALERAYRLAPDSALERALRRD
jgi:hypothetical protein